MRVTLTVLLVAVISCAYSWNVPNLPSGKRSQYFALHNDGGYKYGYDTGKNYFAKQAGDPQNEVAGHYVYKDVSGKDVDVKYTAGVQGFVPEGLEKLLPQSSGPHAPQQSYSYPAPSAYSSVDSFSNDDQANTGDASYSFNIDTDSYKRQESSDASGNVQGKYSYTNAAGNHDLSYIAGSNTGFVATSGSLSQPNGIEGQAAPAARTSYPSSDGSYSPSSADSAVNTDGSYSFGFSTNEQSRQESSDASGNVQGRFSFTNDAGTHDLSYVAGSATGFQPTGGSLSLPNGLEGKSAPVSTYSAPHVGYPAAGSVPADYSPSVPNADGSYSFAYSAKDHSRQESSDASGNVQGKFSFTNEAGTHDLSYVAGSATGFQPTGGSLSLPNGLEGKSAPVSTYSAPHVGYPAAGSAPADYTPTVPNADGSYAFAYSANDQSRQESSDASGNVQGRYSYTNAAGTHDLSYVAGSQTGFMPTGGSLAAPNGLEGKSAPATYSAPDVSGQYVPTTYSGDSTNSADDQANTGDSSYSFTVDTDEYKRQESSDPQGNVKGSFSYKNAAGQHDLSFVAGSATGFLPTGGSLSLPNGLAGKEAPSPVGYSAPASGSYLPPISSYASASQESQDDQANTGDSSYSFTVDTPEYQRKESSDAQGNVQGRYSYKNVAGSHDLSYVAGSSTGFVPTSGSLSVPNGIGGSQIAAPVAAVRYLPPQARASFDHSAVHSGGYSEGIVGNVLLKTYLPSESHSKYGYIFESA